ncbi:phosphatase PAP2 family protein [Amycolatopsis pithecellobii]|uniref:Phosphatase PAP2 family protein n=1 Tax=Amycolatopsis pithecellobii TaxID=664692 RepID=A0A6N7Z9I5_9PSEU|nr:phosphatase PAP2 family protein [Amycolatopsis pithecellobii]MTD58390.1 phosphatase PAP2 family protein [Amycolatopsis pithecellobii]
MRDTVLPTLSRWANYSRLWLAVSGVLALSGNSGARRGALRGLMALSVASFSTNVVLKSLVRRPRPAVDAIPAVRRLRRPPITTSFPSGHSASAAAFTTGVAIEQPLLAVPVAVLASGVATSRVVTGAHYRSDVFAGVTIGIAAGVLTLRWWPRTSPSS